MDIQECTTQRKEELEWLHRMRLLALILEYSNQELEQVSCSYSLSTPRSLGVSSFSTVSTARNKCKCIRAPTLKAYERQSRLGDSMVAVITSLYLTAGTFDHIKMHSQAEMNPIP